MGYFIITATSYPDTFLLCIAAIYITRYLLKAPPCTKLSDWLEYALLLCKSSRLCVSRTELNSLRVEYGRGDAAVLSRDYATGEVGVARCFVGRCWCRSCGVGARMTEGWVWTSCVGTRKLLVPSAGYSGAWKCSAVVPKEDNVTLGKSELELQ